MYAVLFRAARRVAVHLLRRAGYRVPPARRFRRHSVVRGLLLGRGARRGAVRAVWRASRRRRWR